MNPIDYSFYEHANTTFRLYKLQCSPRPQFTTGDESSQAEKKFAALKQLRLLALVTAVIEKIELNVSDVLFCLPSFVWN